MKLKQKISKVGIRDIGILNCGLISSVNPCRKNSTVNRMSRNSIIELISDRWRTKAKLVNHLGEVLRGNGFSRMATTILRGKIKVWRHFSERMEGDIDKLTNGVGSRLLYKGKIFTNLE